MLLCWLLCNGSTTWPVKKKRVERKQSELDFPQVEILPGPYRIIACIYHNLAVPIFYSIFQGPPQKKKIHFLTGLSLHWIPEILVSAFKNPVVISLNCFQLSWKKKSNSFRMTHAYLYLCFYIAMRLKKLNNISRVLHSISLSTQPGFYSCSFSFSPLGCPFF